MPKVKKSFKNNFEASKKLNKEKTAENRGLQRFYSFILDILSSFFKIVAYILICLLLSLGATVIFNSSIREMILNYIF